MAKEEFGYCLQRTKDLSPIACEELDSANNHVSKDGNRSSWVGPGDETSALDSTLMRHLEPESLS